MRNLWKHEFNLLDLFKNLINVCSLFFLILEEINIVFTDTALTSNIETKSCFVFININSSRSCREDTDIIIFWITCIFLWRQFLLFYQFTVVHYQICHIQWILYTLHYQFNTFYLFSHTEKGFNLLFFEYLSPNRVERRQLHKKNLKDVHGTYDKIPTEQALKKVNFQICNGFKMISLDFC